MKDLIDRSIPSRFDRRITILPGKSPPYRVGRDDPFQERAAHVLKAIDGRRPRCSYSGSSIPMPGAVASPQEQLIPRTRILGRF